MKLVSELATRPRPATSERQRCYREYLVGETKYCAGRHSDQQEVFLLSQSLLSTAFSLILPHLW